MILDYTSQFLLSLGCILLLGLATDALGRRTFLPRVTLLVLFGLLVGPEILDLVPSLLTDRFELIADMALLMVGFLLGGKLTGSALRSSGKSMVSISVVAALGATLIVSLGLVLLGFDLEVALLLGCIAAATDAAATVDVITESKSPGPFSDLLAAVVALDDAWALIIFSVGLALVNYYLKMDSGGSVLLLALWEILGAVGLGVALGLPAAFLTGRVKPGQPMLTEALGVVFLCGGLALWLDVSFLIAAMALGATIANLARHHEYPFHEVENIEWPFMAAFFLLAGASLQFEAVFSIGVLGVAYILLRALGKFTGGYLGATLGGTARPVRQWVGVALLPQAGVAIGMGLVAANKFPELGTKLLAVIIGTTVFFELVGPLCTRLALNKVAKAD